MASPQQNPGSRVAVVTVSYASEAVLPAFLDSIRDASSAPLTVVVADNKPAEQSAIRSVTEGSGYTYLALDSNRGYGGAINAAVATLPADVDWILISNPDVELAPRLIDDLLAVADHDGTIGSVGPAILTAEGDVYPSARSIPSLRTGIGHALFANLWLNNPWTRAYRNETTGSSDGRDAGWLSGACLLVRRSAFDQLGGFDEGFFMYFEDVDLGYRLGKGGFRNVYAPNATATHIGAHSTEGESAAMIAAHHESAKRFLTRKYPGWYLWPLRASLSIGLTVRSWAAQRRSVSPATRRRIDRSRS